MTLDGGNSEGLEGRDVFSVLQVADCGSVSAVFLTGSDRIPIHGMESLRIIIQSTTAEEDYLPVAHTCYNLLDMPRYQTKEILRRRLTQAVEQYEGFSLV